MSSCRIINMSMHKFTIKEQNRLISNKTNIYEFINDYAITNTVDIRFIKFATSGLHRCIFAEHAYSTADFPDFAAGVLVLIRHVT